WTCSRFGAGCVNRDPELAKGSGNDKKSSKISFQKMTPDASSFLVMRFRITLFASVLLLDIASGRGAQVSAESKPARARTGAHREISFEKQVRPLFEKYCYACHGNGKKKGDLALDLYKSPVDAIDDPRTWEKILQNVEGHVMPPEKKPQPSPAEAQLILSWIQTQVFKCDCHHPDPGRVTLHRLNRAEYNNTIRDLVGVNYQPAEDFPADDSGYGFDNIGDVLYLPPVLMEKYLAAAEKILAAAIVTDDPAKARIRRFEADNLEGSAPGEAVESGGRRLSREGDIFVNFNFPQDGEYVLRASAYGEQAGPEPPRMTLR